MLFVGSEEKMTHEIAKTCVKMQIKGWQTLKHSVLNFFLFKNLFIFNWRIITLQCCVAFCHTLTWTSRRYTYVPSFLNFPPTSHPTLPLQVVTEHQVWAPCYLFYTWEWVCFNATLSIHPTPPFLCLQICSMSAPLLLLSHVQLFATP